MVARFFKPIKAELIWRNRWDTRRQAEACYRPFGPSWRWRSIDLACGGHVTSVLLYCTLQAFADVHLSDRWTSKKMCLQNGDCWPYLSAKNPKPFGKPQEMSHAVSDLNFLVTPFAPLADEQWPAEAIDLVGGFAGQLNVYRVMAHNPALLRAWGDIREHVVRNNSLGLVRNEVVILRTGVRHDSDYEWSHHVSRARACGLEDSRIASLRGPLGNMTAEDAILAGAVDELLTNSKMSAATIAQLVDLVGKKGVLDVIATVGFYSTLAFIVNTFGTPLDTRIEQELSEQPLKG
jgi:4-carboxymuconolactone decarboxylase